MTKKQAIERGLYDSGISLYLIGYDNILLKIKELRKKRYKCLLVTTPPDPLSRGFLGPSYNIFIDKRYILEKDLKALNEWEKELPGRIDSLAKERDKALSLYDTEIEKLNIQSMQNSTRINDIIHELTEFKKKIVEH